MIWKYDGQDISNEVLVSEGESGPWGSSRYMVHGSTGVRSKTPIDCKTVDEIEKQRAEGAALIAAAGALVEVAIAAALPRLNEERVAHGLEPFKIYGTKNGGVKIVIGKYYYIYKTLEELETRNRRDF